MQTETIDIRTDEALAACLRVARPVAALGFDYTADDHIPVHEHVKAQLLYAIEGTIVLSTREGRWVLLPTRALWVPANTQHSIRMRSAVRMRTLFFDHTVAAPAAGCAVVSVTPLLRELIVSMLQEPRLYAPAAEERRLRHSSQASSVCAIPLPLSLPWAAGCQAPQDLQCHAAETRRYPEIWSIGLHDQA